MRGSLLLLPVVLLLGCDLTLLDIAGGGGAPDPDPEEEEVLPEFARDGMTLAFTMGVDGGEVAVDFLIRYWADLAGDELNCEQRWSAEGGMVAEPTGCPNCSGRLVMLPDTATDVSEPLQRPDDCDPALIAAAQFEVGRMMLTPQQDDGLADLLELSWISAETHDIEGGSLDAQGDFDYDLMQQVASSMGQVYAGVILMNDLGGLSSSISLPDVSGDMSGGSGWSPFFFLLRDPLVNDHEGPDLQGTYAAQGVFSVGFVQ